MESTSALPSNILSSSLDPVVTWIISSRCAWSWLALVNPSGTIFDAAKDLQTVVALIVCKRNIIFIQPRLKTISSLIVLTCFNYLVNFSFTYSFVQKIFPWECKPQPPQYGDQNLWAFSHPVQLFQMPGQQITQRLNINTTMLLLIVLKKQKLISH